MEDEEESKCVCPDGIPAWVMTFADLMSLLMCFFVLLLSFSEMDVQKYKQIAGSMKVAFGVQRTVPVHEIPKGTSVIAKHFSPGKPTPTIISNVRQQTADIDEKKLASASLEKIATQVDARKVAELLKKDVAAGKLEIEVKDNNIVIRIQEKDSFKSGSAVIDESFEPTLKKIHDAIKNIDGVIKVAGHTDDNPISTNLFRSNWELSTARAVSVAHELMKHGKIKENRFEIIGYGDTRPRVPNTTDKNRAINRRVVITIQQIKHPIEETELDEETVEDALQKNKTQLIIPKPKEDKVKPAVQAPVSPAP